MSNIYITEQYGETNTAINIMLFRVEMRFSGVVIIS